ncbi:MAG: hypothetical protein ACERLB_16655, partial [Gammaproteobacteria bacterium]
MKFIVTNDYRASVCKILLATFLLMVGFGPVNAEQPDFAQVVGKLSAKLELDEAQSKKLGSSIEVYMKQLDTLFAEQESEDADPSLLID